MKRITPFAVLVLALAGADVWAQAKPAAAPPTDTTLLRVDVTFNRFQGEKRVGSVQYSVPVNAGDESVGSISMGLQVPLRYEGKEFPGNAVFKNVGNTVRCRAWALGDARYKLACGFEQSTVYAEGSPAAAAGRTSGAPPVLRTFNSDATLVLRDGQTAQHLLATDFSSGEVVRVDVTLAVLK